MSAAVGTIGSPAFAGLAERIHYNYGVVRLFTIASVFWGVAAFLVGVVSIDRMALEFASENLISGWHEISPSPHDSARRVSLTRA